MGGALLLAVTVATNTLVPQAPVVPILAPVSAAPVEAAALPTPATVAGELKPHKRSFGFDLAIGGLAGGSASDLTFTLYALHRGGGEGNPVLHPLGPHPIALATAKAGMTVATIYALIKLHERHPKIATLAAAGAASVMMGVAARNAGVLRQLRR